MKSKSKKAENKKTEKKKPEKKEPEKKEPKNKDKEKPAPKKRRGRKKSNKPHYVNGKELLAQIQDFYDNEEKGVSNLLATNVYKIAKGLSFAPNFINYSYKDDMIGDAAVKMFTALQGKKFDCSSGYNPFSYFTTIAFHAFINRIKKEKKYREVVTEYQEAVYDELMDSDIDTKQQVDYTTPYDNEE